MPWKPDYISVSDLKTYINVSDGIDDVQLAVWCTAASRAIDNRCNRQFGQLAAPAARTYRQPTFYEPVRGLWMLEIDDLQDLTGMTIDGVAYASTGAVLMPENAPADGMPWTHLGFTENPNPYGSSYGPLTATVVVARWGWSAAPAQVVGAAKLQANRWSKRRSAPFGVAGSPEQGSEIRLLSKLDPDVATTLAGLRRPRKVG